MPQRFSDAPARMLVFIHKKRDQHQAQPQKYPPTATMVKYDNSLFHGYRLAIRQIARHDIRNALFDEKRIPRGQTNDRFLAVRFHGLNQFRVNDNSLIIQAVELNHQTASACVGMPTDAFHCVTQLLSAGSGFSSIIRS